MKSEKIHILTFPLRFNYGGILQAFAMQRQLQLLHIEPSLYQNCSKPPLKRKLVDKVRKLLPARLRKWSLRKALIVAFSTGYINTCYAINPKVRKWVVGSDQIWRCQYSRPFAPMPTWFLSNIPKEVRAQSITYAVSFGCDEWEGTPEETEECAKLLKEFKAVSVREHSAVKLCKDIFGVDAVQMPDPTLLLTTGEYQKIMEADGVTKHPAPYVLSYVLDKARHIDTLLQQCASRLHLELLNTGLDSAQNLTVPQWVANISQCEYLITDSFHGCVFAIIFNRPFICLGNETRGTTRFDTLLKTFGLEDRMLTSWDEASIHAQLEAPIDWERVNSIHEAERTRGLNFLIEHLLTS